MERSLNVDAGAQQSEMSPSHAAQIHTLEASLADGAERIRILEDELRKQVAYSQTEIRELNATIESLRQQQQLAESAQMTHDDSTAHLQKLHQQFLQSEEALQRKYDENERMYNEKIATLEAELKSQVSYSNSETESLRMRIKELENANDHSIAVRQSRALQSSNDNTALEQLSAELEQLHKEKHALQQEADSAAERAIVLQDELRRQITYSEAEIQRLQDQVIALQHQVMGETAAPLKDTVTPEMELLQHQLSTAHQQFIEDKESLQAQLRKLTTIKTDLENALSFAQEENKAASTKIRELQIELEAQVEYTQSENSGLNTSNERLKKSLEEARNTIGEWQ